VTRAQIQEKLRAAGIENALFEAMQLCASMSGEALENAVERRCNGYPLQYLLGEWDFYRQRYEVSEDCLIPRADTELLVEKAIGMLPEGAQFLDLCTGSGCIAISTLCERPDTRCTAVDLFERTLALAARNADRNGVAARMTCRIADVLRLPEGELAMQKFDAILSNPPYIRDDVVPVLQREVQHEPAAALRGGADGLDFYRSILERWSMLLKPDGFLLLEIGYDQADDLRALSEKHGFSHTVYRDLGGNDRVVYLKK